MFVPFLPLKRDKKWKEIIFILFLKKILTHTHAHSPGVVSHIFSYCQKLLLLVVCLGWMSFQCGSPEKEFESHCASSLAAGCRVNGNSRMRLPPEKKKKKRCLQAVFKASLVLLSDTRQSARGEPGESQDDTNKTDPSRRETNKRRERKREKNKTKPRIQAKEPSFQNESVYSKIYTRKLNAMPAWSAPPPPRLWLCGEVEQRNTVEAFDSGKTMSVTNQKSF